jgi:hypothetical protein
MGVRLVATPRAPQVRRCRKCSRGRPATAKAAQVEDQAGQRRRPRLLGGGPSGHDGPRLFVVVVLCRPEALSAVEALLLFAGISESRDRFSSRRYHARMDQDEV